ncbi:MAG: hypothetical protein JWN48_388 [Myxococcaceae bacterium]|nr:hypothetical protein [Myxococcaceae bacterium]
MATKALLYAALGDSTGVGVGALDGRGYVARLFTRLSRLRPEARLLNACTSGAVSRHVLERQLPRVLSAQPSLVTVFVGINDLIQGVAPSSFGQHVDEVARALAGGGARCLFCTVPDLSHAPAASAFISALGVKRSLFETRTLALNAQIVHSAHVHGHAVHDLFTAALQDKERFFSSDGFHPSAHGYEELAEQLWPALARQLERVPL